MRRQSRQKTTKKSRFLPTLMAVFALGMQPLYGGLAAQSATATSAAISKFEFVSSAQTILVNDRSGELEVRTKNVSNEIEKLDSNATLSVSSSSSTGQFANNANAPWRPVGPTTFTMNGGTSLKSFYYKDSKPGTYTITAKVTGGGLTSELTTTQTITVNNLPLSQRIAQAAPGDTIDVTANETVTGAIGINKPLTLTSTNGSTITTSGSGNLFRITAPNVVVSNLKFIKTDSVNQHIISIGANNTTISGNTFKGQYVLGGGEVTRALELSTATGYNITGNTITNLRQPAYINDNSAGVITNNYVADTRGWVVVANTKFAFTGNTFGANATDIAIIPGSPNNYTCDVMRTMLANNSNPKIDNQVLNIATCDMTAPSVPTGGAPHEAYRTTNEFDFTWDASTDDKPGDIKYQFRSSQSTAQVGNAPDNSGAWMSGELSSPSIHSSGAGDGTWYWQVRAIDLAGNKSDWSATWNMTIDTKPPALTVVRPANGDIFGDESSKTFTVESFLEDEQGLGRYHIDIDGVNPMISQAKSDENEDYSVSASASLTILTIFKTKDFLNGMHTINIWVTDKAGNKTSTSRTIMIDNTADDTVIPDTGFGGGISTPGTDELTQLGASLLQPFAIPTSFGVTPLVTAGVTPNTNSAVLGTQTAKDPNTDSNAKNVAVAATENGWKLFGIHWYWWVGILGGLGAVTTWFVLRARRAAAGDIGL